MYRMTIEKVVEKEVEQTLESQWGTPKKQLVMADVVERALTVSLTDEEYQAVKKGVLEVFK